MAQPLTQLTILHTNDLHSQLEQVPKIHTYVESVRQAIPSDHLLLVDIGDHMDRMRLETEGSLGLVNIEAMNAMGYDAIVLGNNEGLTFTPDVLTDLYSRHATFDIISSNLLDPQSQRCLPWMKPYGILERAGIRIGLIGVTAAFRTYYELLGWQVLDPIQVVCQYTELLRNQVDVLVVLSHLGLGLDQQMAHEIKGIDVILGGHTHHVLEQPLVIGTTTICAAGKLGQFIGQVKITFDVEIRQIREVSSQLVEMADELDHPLTSQIIQHHRYHSEIALNQEIAHLQEPLVLDWHHESPLGNLLASGLRHWTGADIAIVNSGQLLHGLEAGRVTRQHLLEICPGPINPCKMLLRGAQIWQALEESLLDEFTHKLIRGFGFRGEVLGMLNVDGLRVEYSRSRPAMNQVIAVYVQDNPLDIDHDYLVATIDMFTFGVGHLSLSRGESIEYFLPEFLRDVLAKQLQVPSAVEHSKLVSSWVDCTSKDLN